jgi:hypothetical protein
MSWRAVLIWWFVCSCLGVALIALPDSGPRLLTFSRAHGPGMVDSLGIVLLLLGTGLLWGYLWRRRADFKPFPPSWAFLGGVGCGLLLASVAADFGLWWAGGAALLVFVQAAMFWKARAA